MSNDNNARYNKESWVESKHKHKDMFRSSSHLLYVSAFTLKNFHYLHKTTPQRKQSPTQEEGTKPMNLYTGGGHKAKLQS